MLLRSAVWIGLISAALVAASTVAAPDDQTRKDEAFSRAASAIVDRVEREDGFSGVILVARGDKVLLRKAAGFADRERQIRNTPETKFPLESVTKQFTATAIMMVVDDGKISLDDSILKYYPEGPTAWRDVKIRHLLTHSSGIEEQPGTFLPRGDFFRAVQSDGLRFKPGGGFRYSNTGYALLAEVVKRVSGTSYGDFLAKRIFGPLQMCNTGFGEIPNNIVKGYVRVDGELRTGRVQRPDILAAGAGGIYSTVDDMLLWSLAQGGDRLLSSQSRAAMFTDYGFDYGFGVRFSPKFGRKLIWHTGNSPDGFASIFDRFPDDELTVVAMTNAESPTHSKATLLIEGKVQTFPANAMRKAVEQVERLYFGREP
ncbi:MAG: beta-lactamase family protein [Alphaproteobacteria bacterium]|nr:beta-lactamase family protein [Alphaproteobacteria bacterium]